MIMKVKGNLQIEVDPIEVIENLMPSNDGYYTKENGKYYHNYELSLGSHSIEDKEEVSKERYEYVQALKTVAKNLKTYLL